MRDTVFIHTNRKQRLGALVAAYSLKTRSATPDAFDVRIIWAEDYPFIKERDGQAYLREGRQVLWIEDDLQSFPPLRFDPPRLMGYQGRAVVMDPDVFAVGDIAELLRRDMRGHAVLAKRMPPDGRKPGHWATSVMLLDCAKLTHWDVERDFGRLFAGERDYNDWMWLLAEPEGTVGELEEQWNHFDTLDATTKLLHNTHRRTQPWKTGLAADFIPRGKHVDAGGSFFTRALARLRGKQEGRRGRYKPHPDPKQEQFFFGLLREALAANAFPLSVVEEEIEYRHVRPDALALVNAAGTKASA
jgi:hypothetical protein